MSFYKIIKDTKEPKNVIVIGVNNEPKDNIKVIDYEIVEEEKNKIYKSGFDDGFNYCKKIIEDEKIKEIEEIKKSLKIHFKSRFKNILVKLINKFEKYNTDLREKLYQVIIKLLNHKDNLKESLKNNITDMLTDINCDNEVIIYLSKDDFKIFSEDEDFFNFLNSKFKKFKIEEKVELSKGDVEIQENKRILSNKLADKLQMAEQILKDNKKLEEINFITEQGIVTKITGNILEVEGLNCKIGDMCEIITDDVQKIKGEVIGYRDSKNILMVFGDTKGIGPKSKVINLKKKFMIKVNTNMLGRVLDGSGEFIDGKGVLNEFEEKEIYNKIPDPFERKRISEVILTGIRAIDIFLTCGKGQRVGIFAGSGVGKSSLLGMIARNTNADINVIALIGERGREVKDFIERDLKEVGLKRSVIVASTSDKSALERIHGALIAMTIAEYYKDKGKSVLFMMDSVTRLAMALREIGLAVGEIPSTKGYTSSVFSQLSKFIERSGNFINGGSITAFLTVLVEGDDFNEPIADAMRSFLDGHIILSRKLAEKGHYPSIEINSSVSRLMNELISNEHLKYSNITKEAISIVKEMEDLINIGAYKKGTNKKIDYSLNVYEKIIEFLRQNIDEKAEFDKDLLNLEKILKV